METFKELLLETICEGLPENKIITEWIEEGGVSDLIDRIIQILFAKLNEGD